MQSLHFHRPVWSIPASLVENSQRYYFFLDLKASKDPDSYITALMPGIPVQLDGSQVVKGAILPKRALKICKLMVI